MVHIVSRGTRIKWQESVQSEGEVIANVNLKISDFSGEYVTYLVGDALGD